jgi:hypothetical protein
LPWAIPKRLYLLDAMRGIAALSVVISHWRHFFLPFNSTWCAPWKGAPDSDASVITPEMIEAGRASFEDLELAMRSRALLSERAPTLLPGCSCR